MKVPVLSRVEYRKLVESAAEDQPRLFLRYCRKVLQASADGLATPQEAAYAIAGTTFPPRVSHDSILEEITLLAGHLELPLHVLGGAARANKLWRELEDQLALAEVQYT
jgi:hypothetical protein